MTQTAQLPADDRDATLMHFDDLRGTRYAEIILFGGDPATGPQVGSIYNTGGLNDPDGTGDTTPQEILDHVDAATLAKEYNVLAVMKNAPRLWTLDWAEVMAGAVRDFQGLRARWIMWLDVTAEMREHESTPYMMMSGKRDTRLGINTGSPAFILDDPDGNSWVMKSASLIVDPGQTYDSLKDLGGRLHLPEGWQFRTVELDRDLVLTADNGAIQITQDEFGNTYDRVGGPYSNYRP